MGNPQNVGNPNNLGNPNSLRGVTPKIGVTGNPNNWGGIRNKKRKEREEYADAPLVLDLARISWSRISRKRKTDSVLAYNVR